MCAALLSLTLTASAESPAEPEQQPSPSPTPSSTAQPPAASPKPFQLNLEKHVEEEVTKLEGSLPRFQESVTVIGKTPQVMIERFFGGVDLECGPALTGAPTTQEMREFRPHTGPYVDFLALSRILVEKLQGKSRGPGPANAKYYLYRIRRGGGVSYSLRESRVPEAWIYNMPGTSFELLETFDDPKAAVEAWRRMERGFATPLPASSASPPPPWVTIPCRPRR